MGHKISISDPPSEGCYKDDLQNPEFVISPGGYDPKLINPSACSALCQGHGYLYAGVQEGRLCLCSNTIQSKCMPSRHETNANTTS